jgi:hypothetical protein
MYLAFNPQETPQTLVVMSADWDTPVVHEQLWYITRAVPFVSYLLFLSKNYLCVFHLPLLLVYLKPSRGVGSRQRHGIDRCSGKTS